MDPFASKLFVHVFGVESKVENRRRIRQDLRAGIAHSEALLSDLTLERFADTTGGSRLSRAIINFFVWPW
jgi:hypothetical protein